MKAIVAVDKNWGIGKDNGMLFHMPADLEYFKQNTLGKVIVMGRNTLLSLPGAKPLPKRTNIVLSSLLTRDDCVVVPDMDALRDKLKNYPPDDIFIIGGERFYNAMLPYCEKALVTKANAEGDATHFFDNLDITPGWELESESEPVITNGYEIKFCVYKNTNPRDFFGGKQI